MKFKKRSQKAYMYCQHMNFENFLKAQDLLIPEWTNTKNALKHKLGIDSLSELDCPDNKELISRYDELIKRYHHQSYQNQK